MKQLFDPAVLGGTAIRDLMDRRGKRMTDAHLVRLSALAEDGNLIRALQDAVQVVEVVAA